MPLLRPTMVLSHLELPDEPTFVRKLSLNIVVMGLLTGASLRLYRALILQAGWSNSWIWIAGTFLGGVGILFLLATMHLGNYPVRSWTWRAPLFAIIEAATEVGVSLALTVAGLERIGSLTATLEDWQGSAMRLALVRFVGILLFALVLAFVSTVVRLVLLPRKPVHQQPVHQETPP